MKTVFSHLPNEWRGGSKTNHRPSAATTIPSDHFSVEPPRKQASTGNNATASVFQTGRVCTVYPTGARDVSTLFGIGAGKNHWYGNSYFERCTFSALRVYDFPGLRSHS